MRKLPLDYPVAKRPHRIYITLTNACNRDCPWCSTYSSTQKSTYLDIEKLKVALPKDKIFEAQLEGGEPTVHPDFFDFVEAFKRHENCKRIVLCTNGVILPRMYDALKAWVARLGDHLTIKLSFNHYLLETTPDLVSFVHTLRAVMDDLQGDRLFVLNARRRKGVKHDDQWMVDLIRQEGWSDCANIFFLQRYGFASQQKHWELPMTVAHNFSYINPDGKIIGPDLIARSEAMRTLP